MTQPTPEANQAAEVSPDEQETLRLAGADQAAPADPDATRPMSLADLLNSD